MFLNNPPYTTFDQIRDEITTDECVLLGNGASINDLDFDRSHSILLSESTGSVKYLRLTSMSRSIIT